jgi:hypothetical protein
MQSPEPRLAQNAGHRRQPQRSKKHILCSSLPRLPLNTPFQPASPPSLVRTPLLVRAPLVPAPTAATPAAPPTAVRVLGVGLAVAVVVQPVPAARLPRLPHAADAHDGVVPLVLGHLHHQPGPKTGLAPLLAGGDAGLPRGVGLRVGGVGAVDLDGVAKGALAGELDVVAGALPGGFVCVRVCVWGGVLV